MNPPSPERWVQLWQQADGTGEPLSIYRELVAHYSQAQRYYHNLNHIAECLSEFDSTRHLASQPVAVELALWFHDAIYDTRAQDNEERSAELARQRLADARVSAELCKAVATLVMATKTHEPSHHPDAPLLVDVDLSILGQPSERFQAYEAQVRREYDWVPEKTFAAKRAEILDHFLARRQIYLTGHFSARYERQARINLLKSVQQLRRS